MKIKLDENIGEIGAAFLTAAGHEVSTVLAQQLSGSDDESLYATCRAAGQVLITLDRDFGEVIRFPPEGTAGIVILDCRGRLFTRSDLCANSRVCRGNKEQRRSGSFVDRRTWTRSDTSKPGRLRLQGREARGGHREQHQ